MKDENNAVKSLNTDRTESGMNSWRKSSSSSCKQSSLCHEYSKSEIESKFSKVKIDSEHSIGPSNLVRYSKFDNKSELQQAESGLIHIKMKEHCFSDKNEKEQVGELHSPKQERKVEVDESSVKFVDQCLRRPPGKTLEKSFEESKSQVTRIFEQAQLERDSNRINNLTSQNDCYSDDNCKYVQKLNEILDSIESDKSTEKFDRMTSEHLDSEIKDTDHVNFEENKNHLEEEKCDFNNGDFKNEEFFDEIVRI